jgi:NAD(P)-dependent dehydrogenase (short-subunit alcohol dehydrogenase family)
LTGFTAADVPDQAGKCFIVTGANTGVGFEAARVLAARGGRVLLACRSEAKAEAAVSRIRREVAGADVGFLPLDLSDLASVRRAAELASRERRLDVLLNNAGVMIPPLARTAQGFELQFGVNHLGGFALTALLLPKLAETPGSRVVITASLAHQRGDLRWDDLNAEKSYSRIPRYAASKLANMLHLFELDRRLRAAGSPTTAVGCHPGAAATELMRHTGVARLANPAMRALFNTAAMGAWPALQAAAAPDVDPGGYYGPQGIGEMRGASGPARRTRRARDPDWARRLWDVSIAMTGVDPGLAPA